MYIVGIEKIPTEDLHKIIVEATEELANREAHTRKLVDDIARAIYRALNEGVTVSILHENGKIEIDNNFDFVVAAK